MYPKLSLRTLIMVWWCLSIQTLHGLVVSLYPNPWLVLSLFPFSWSPLISHHSLNLLTHALLLSWPCTFSLWPWLPSFFSLHPLFIFASIYVNFGIRASSDLAWISNPTRLQSIPSTLKHNPHLWCSIFQNSRMSSSMPLEEKYEALM